jgi:hypothetical protein
VAASYAQSQLVPRKPDPADDAATVEAERRPEVVLDVLFEDGLLFLVVANTGEAAAHGVSCRFRRRLRGLGGTEDVSKLPLFEHIAYLGPGREIRTLLDSSAAFFARDEPTRVTVTTWYADGSGRTYTSTVEHELAIYRDLAYVPRKVPPDA